MPNGRGIPPRGRVDYSFCRLRRARGGTMGHIGTERRGLGSAAGMIMVPDRTVADSVTGG